MPVMGIILRILFHDVYGWWLAAEGGLFFGDFYTFTTVCVFFGVLILRVWLGYFLYTDIFGF